MSREEVISIIKSNSILPDSKFGQNFLCDDSVIEDIIEISGACPNSNVLEIGPGIGALTRQLCLMNKNNNSDMRIYSVEIDKRLASFLQDDEEISQYSKVICSDFLKLPQDLIDCSIDYILSNIPYYVMTSIIKKLIIDYPESKQMTLMIEDDAFARVDAKPSTRQYGPLSVFCSNYGIVRKEFVVDSSRFYPAPHTTSCVITLKKRIDSRIISPDYYDFVEAAFSKRRKTLQNSLNEYFARKTPSVSLSDALLALELDGRVRSEAVSPEQFVFLFCMLYQ